MYNALIDIALMGAAMAVVGIIIAKEPKVKRGAVKMRRRKIPLMQEIRRLENDL